MSARIYLLAACCVLAAPEILSRWAVAEEAAPENDEQATISQLIEQLGSESYAEREAAQRRLAEFGFAAFDALIEAENDRDIEIAARARYLVRLMQVQWTTETDSQTVKALLQGYGQLPEELRLAKIRELARLNEDQGLEALCRLVRFEKSEVISKWAAAELVSQAPPQGADLEQRSATILAAIARSPRPAAEWLRVYAQGQADPQAAIEPWAKLVEAERQTFEQTPDQSRTEIVAALLRYQVDWLDRLDRDDEALEAMRRMVQFERGDTENLLALLNWLVQRQAWPVVEELQQKFAGRFEQELALAYALADARLAEGREADADEWAAKARALKPGDPGEHLAIAQQLRQRGKTRWAEAELRQIAQSGQADNGTVMLAYFLLADMIYDRAEYQAAAELLDAHVKEIDTKLAAPDTDANTKRLLSSVRGRLAGRMHYYYAMRFHETEEGDKETEHLDKALAYDQNDIDVLIALHRLKEPGDERHKRTEQLIEETAATYQQMLENQPNEAMPYNQLAWLWANTDRRLKDALAYSQRSLELKPNEAGYLDTLARCYFALGDYEQAAKHQAEAVKLDPHSGQMNRQLKLFEEALEKQRDKK